MKSFYLELLIIIAKIMSFLELKLFKKVNTKISKMRKIDFVRYLPKIG